MRPASLILLFVLSIALSSRAGVFETQIEQASDGNGNYAQFRLWLPAGAHTDQLLVLVWGSNQCALDMASDPTWQELAQTMNCGLMTCFFVPQSSENRWDVAGGGSGQMVLEALQTFAKMSGEGQLSTAHLYLVGDSQGGQFSFNFAGWRPDRVLGFVSLKGGHHDEISIENAARIPGLFFGGEFDLPFRLKNITQTFVKGREQGAPWCLAIDKQGNHDPGPCAPLVYDFLKELSAAQSGNSSFHSRIISDNKKGLVQPAFLPSWFPSEKFEQDWKLFEMGKLSSTHTNLSFESKNPATLAKAIPSSCNLETIKSGEKSQAITIRVIPIDSSRWDDVKILERPYLSDSKIEDHLPQDVSISFRLNTQDQPLGRFLGALPIRFIQRGKPVQGGLNIPIAASVEGDVIAKPALVYLGAIRPENKIWITIQIDSKTNAPIKLLSCRSPKGIELAALPLSGCPLDLTFSFSFASGSPREIVSGAILLRLKSNHEWALRIPYVGTIEESP